MAVARPILGLAAIILLAGGLVMNFFIILSGIRKSPVNQVYFLQADTGSTLNSNLGERDPIRWTFLALCGVNSYGHNAHCNPTVAGLTFDPVSNFGTTDGVPSPFLDTSYWFYMSRFTWVFYLIATFFGVISFFLSITSLFARLGAYLTGFVAFFAVFFQALTAALLTAWVVKARDAWQSNGIDAQIGEKALGFTWGTFAAFFIASLFFCVGGAVSGSSSSSGKKSLFGRKKSTRSRGSFIGSDRVKDDYE